MMYTCRHDISTLQLKGRIWLGVLDKSRKQYTVYFGVSTVQGGKHVGFAVVRFRV